jgi:hypothetical protein
MRLKHKVLATVDINGSLVYFAPDSIEPVKVDVASLLTLVSTLDNEIRDADADSVLGFITDDELTLTSSLNNKLTINGTTSTFVQGTGTTLGRLILTSTTTTTSSTTATNTASVVTNSATPIVTITANDGSLSSIAEVSNATVRLRSLFGTSFGNVTTGRDTVLISTNPSGVLNNRVLLLDGTGVSIDSVSDNITLSTTATNQISATVVDSSIVITENRVLINADTNTATLDLNTTSATLSATNAVNINGTTAVNLDSTALIDASVNDGAGNVSSINISPTRILDSVTDGTNTLSVQAQGLGTYTITLNDGSIVQTQISTAVDYNLVIDALNKLVIGQATTQITQGNPASTYGRVEVNSAGTIFTVTNGTISNINTGSVSQTLHSIANATNTVTHTMNITGAGTVPAHLLESLDATSRSFAQILKGSLTLRSGLVSLVDVSNIIMSASGIDLTFAGACDLKLNGSAGTTGQALLSTGAGTAPVWGAPVTKTYSDAFIIADWGAGTTLTYAAATHGLGAGLHQVMVYTSAGDVVAIGAVLTNVNVNSGTGDVVITIVNNGAAFDGSIHII